jgi:hypothetical protein
MKAEFRLFALLTVVIAIFAVLYAWWTDANGGAVEWVGTVGLVLSMLLTLMCGGFFWVVSRRIDLRPEDRPDAEIVEGAGEIGFFSPGSYWPVGVALAAATAALGLVFFQVWLIVVGMIAVIIAVGGLLFEYYTGSRRSAEH